MKDFLYINYKNNQFGFCNIDETQLIPNEYQEVKEFKNNSTWVKKDNFWFLINNKNQKLTKETYEEVLLFEQNFSIVKKDNTFFCIENINGSIKAKTNLQIIDINFESAIVINKDKTKSFIDIETLKVNENKYEDIKLFSEGYAPFKENNLWGLINNKYEVVIKPQYESMNLLSCSLIKVSLNNNYFFIDTKNNQYLNQIKNKYVYNDQFNDGYIVVNYKNKIGCMNDFFEVYFLKKFEYLSDFEDEYAIFKKNNKFGVIKYNGKILIKPIYDQILHKKNDLFFVKRKDQYTYVGFDQKELFKISN